MGSVRVDPFFYKQPPLLFVEELKKPLHSEKPDWFCRSVPDAGEVSTAGMYLHREFPDNEGLLETAIADFEAFLSVYEISGNRYPVKLAYRETECFEAYRICISENECTIEAADTEGIRRALVYLEDEMCRREGPFLPLGSISRKPVIRERITRGFFSPTNRPPKNVDELLDDVDYYPDAYLNRLAQDGTNGLWIYTHFNKLLPSDVFTEYGENSQKRIEKLKRVVAKCKRYGVKVWVFGVEPSSLPEEIVAKHPNAGGVRAWNQNYTVCPYSEEGAEYCIEVTRRLMEQVPDLGGVIDITYGERPTNCANADYHQCPRCRNYSKSQIIARTADLLKEGIRRAGSKADFVSWTYAHRTSSAGEISEYVREAPSDVMLMENFEDNGYTEQLGKTRQAIDYWLSYVGPSQMFEGAAKTALEENKHMFAKMQVCCSHELATVPYIPAPGILFDKYAAAVKYGVEGVMQCWYFGNYPSLMSKAAGELSFMEDFSEKDRFLTHLAGIYYGSQAGKAVEAWKHFEEGYKRYPVNIMFSYYGPMHDSVVWELALLPKDTALPRTWQLMDKPDGDRIGECLQSGHTLSEAVELTDHMAQQWKIGVQCLPENTPAEQRTVAQALELLLSSGNRILRFYALREKLALGQGNAEALLDEMETIVDAEIRSSEAMTVLCRQDSRLGYHSEAEGFKFFPEKLTSRIGRLQKLKAEEFPRVRAALAAGMHPLPWYLGDPIRGYQMRKGTLEQAEFTPIADQGTFRMAYDNENLYLELKGKPNAVFSIGFEYRLLWPAPGIFARDGKLELFGNAITHQSVWGDKIQQELDKYQLLMSQPEQGHYVIAISREKTGWTEDRPLRVRIAALVATGWKSWKYDDDPVSTLGKFSASPGEFGWLMP